MKYTMDDYKNVCYAAGNLSIAVEALKEAQSDIIDGGWSNFGKCLDAVFDACDEYNRVNNQCAIEAYCREENEED